MSSLEWDGAGKVVDRNRSKKEEINGGSKKEEVTTKKKIFAPNLTKSDQINQALAEGMTENDEFLYENGGGAEALWKLIDLEAQQKMQAHQILWWGTARGAHVGPKERKKRKVCSAGSHRGTTTRQHTQNKDNLSCVILAFNSRWSHRDRNQHNNH